MPSQPVTTRSAERARSLHPQHLDARQRLAFHPFQERAAGGRHIGEPVGHAGRVERRDRVAAARHRDELAGRGQFGGGFARPRWCRCRTAPSRRRRTGRSRPASCTRASTEIDVLDRCAGRCRGSSRPRRRRRRRRRARRALASNFAPPRRRPAARSRSCGLRLGQNVARGRHADRARRATCRRPCPAQQEGVGHAAADDQHVDLGDEVAEQVELGRHLGAADDGGDRPLRRVQRLVERVELGLHAAARIGGQQVAEPFGRGMRAVRHREGVVDADVAELPRARATKAGSFFSSPAWKRVFSRQQDVAGLRARRPPSWPARRCSPPRTRPAGRSPWRPRPRPAASVSFGSRPFGRPRCDSRITLPPLPAISLMVGAMRSMRVASATLPSFIGTLRSTRSSTRLPFKSQSSSSV